MQQRHLTSMFVLTGSLLGGCLVQLPGNLDAGDSTSDDDGDSGDGDGDTESGDGDTGDGDGEPGDGDGDPGNPTPTDGDGCQTALDVLLILDNSGSMGEEQALMASALIEPLLGPLDDTGVDWRLAVTTTDVGNPWCPPGNTTPEQGAFKFSSCNERLEDFLFNNGEVDVTDVACNSLCPYAPGKLHALPTTTAEDQVAKPRPWIERIGGVSNLPEDVDPVSAALCIVPQGINGCGFEQPLEALDLAVQRTEDPMSPEYGFLREDASLLVIFVTDEEDCSWANESIFMQDGAKTFWSDQSAAFPTSAVCWNAGTRCIGDPSGYDDCVSANYDEFGNEVPHDMAVLEPVTGYMNTLLDIEEAKRTLDPGADVSVLVIGGLGLDGQLHYADVGMVDPQFQDSFGIGPGCVVEVPDGEPVTAVPPVRLREVGAALSTQPLASICAPSFVDSLAGAYDQLFGACE
jgi:hypothetical protein